MWLDENFDSITWFKETAVFSTSRDFLDATYVLLFQNTMAHWCVLIIVRCNLGGFSGVKTLEDKFILKDFDGRMLMRMVRKMEGLDA